MFNKLFQIGLLLMLLLGLISLGSLLRYEVKISGREWMICDHWTGKITFGDMEGPDLAVDIPKDAYRYDDRDVK